MLPPSSGSLLPPFASRVDTAARAGVSVVVRGDARTDRLVIGQMLHAGGSKSALPFRVVEERPASTSATPNSGANQPETLVTVLRDLATRGQGTLFVDRVDCLSISDQHHLLRALQDPGHDLRVIAGTRSDLAELVAEGSFLSMLYARLKVVELIVPVGLSNQEATSVQTTGASPCGPSPTQDWSLHRAVKRAERTHLVAALRHHLGNRTHTAKSLGISRKNLWEKMKAHEIRAQEYEVTQSN